MVGMEAWRNGIESRKAEERKKIEKRRRQSRSEFLPQTKIPLILGENLSRSIKNQALLAHICTLFSLASIEECTPLHYPSCLCVTL